MEWSRIEAKWHAMARRLQQAPMPGDATTAPAIDAVNRPEPNRPVEPVPSIADDATARATV